MLRFHNKYSRSFVLRDGNFSYWDGLKRLDDWSIGTIEITKSGASVPIGFFNSSTVLLARVGQNSLRVVSHDVEIELSEPETFVPGAGHEANTIFFAPGTIVDRCTG